MRILHTESSEGWGGQEIRILKEAEGMRARGHEVFFAVSKGGGLVAKAKEKGFIVYEVSFQKKEGFKTIPALLKVLRSHSIDLVNTHSSLDAWVGGVAARIGRKKIVRTRHLSAPIRKGLNSRLLYKTLADYIVTTSSGIIPMICEQARQSPSLCQCIPTGVDPKLVQTTPEKVEQFRASLGLNKGDVLVGTLCFVRSWKGIIDFLTAAQELQKEPHLKWVIVGGGHVKEYQEVAKERGLDAILTFTGHLDSPYSAIAAMDIFALLSTANEGISQASLQAAYMGKPLITTPIGGLPEVCLEGKTGLLVPPFAPAKVVEAVLRLKHDPDLRKELGAHARALVEEKFLFSHTLDRMEEVIGSLVN